MFSLGSLAALHRTTYKSEPSCSNHLILKHPKTTQSFRSPKDGMDQSKWCLPRHRLLQQSKEFQGLQRPRCKIHAVWCHGVQLSLFVIHPGVPADSSLVVECFNRVMEQVVERFKEKERRLPSQALIWVTWLKFEQLKIINFTVAVLLRSTESF